MWYPPNSIRAGKRPLTNALSFRSAALSQALHPHRPISNMPSPTTLAKGAFSHTWLIFCFAAPLLASTSPANLPFVTTYPLQQSSYLYRCCPLLHHSSQPRTPLFSIFSLYSLCCLWAPSSPLSKRISTACAVLGAQFPIRNRTVESNNPSLEASPVLRLGILLDQKKPFRQK